MSSLPKVGDSSSLYTLSEAEPAAESVPVCVRSDMPSDEASRGSSISPFSAKSRSISLMRLRLASTMLFMSLAKVAAVEGSSKR